MSPLAGRFLTRDPIGYVGSKWGLYEFLDDHGLKAFDPFGKVKITTVEDELSHPITECTKGKQLGMAYLFEVENKCPGGDGWIVQEITVQCNVNKCKESKECPRKGSGKSVHFFEAWRITDGATNPNDPSPNYTDVSPFTINKDTCGYFRADGGVRFICDEDIPAGTGPNCPVIVTGGLPTSHETPGWWGASREASAKRFYEVTWSNCCMCNIQQDGEPKK